MTSLKTRFGQFLQWFKRDRADRMDDACEAAAILDAAEAPEREETAVRRVNKESALQQLQRGYEEVVELMGSVRTHMKEQADRSDRLLTMLDGLPEALRSLPEVSRSQTRTLEAIQGNLQQQAQQNSRLADALSNMAKTNQQHQHAMTAIGRQLDAGQQCTEQMLGSFTSLSGTLGRMSQNNEASTGLLRQIAEQESKAAEQVRALFARNQKHMTTMSVVSWSLAIVALTVAGYVAVSVSRMTDRPDQPTTPAVNAPAKTGEGDQKIVPTASRSARPAEAEPAAPVNLLDEPEFGASPASPASPEPAQTSEVPAEGDTQATDLAVAGEDAPADLPPELYTLP